MAKITLPCLVNARVAIWIHYLSFQQGQSTSQYIQNVLLRHLQQSPGVDLSRSPYSEPKGVSDGKKDRGK
jgi:hypothetical protein